MVRAQRLQQMSTHFAQLKPSADDWFPPRGTSSCRATPRGKPRRDGQISGLAFREGGRQANPCQPLFHQVFVAGPPMLGGFQNGQRNERKLRTTSEMLDNLLTGNLAGAAYVLPQRFKALETSVCGLLWLWWRLVRDLDIIPEKGASVTPYRQREQVSELELQEIPLRARLTAHSQRAWGFAFLVGTQPGSGTSSQSVSLQATPSVHSRKRGTGPEKAQVPQPPSHSVNKGSSPQQRIPALRETGKANRRTQAVPDPESCSPRATAGPSPSPAKRVAFAQHIEDARGQHAYPWDGAPLQRRGHQSGQEERRVALRCPVRVSPSRGPGRFSTAAKACRTGKGARGTNRGRGNPRRCFK